jgi:hypothetical protein
MEMWKPVLGFEGLYEISDQGNIRRMARGKLFSAKQIESAKQMFCDGATLKRVAEFLQTSITTAHSIKQGKTWKGDAKFRPVKTKIGSDFYVYFTPSKDGVYRHRPIHRCIWEAFVGPIEGRLEINHKNLDRQDNRLENLEIVTHQQNCQHAHKVYAKERQHLVKGERSGPRSKYAIIKHT